MPYTSRTIELGDNDAGRRLDRVLRAACPDVGLSAIYRMLRDGDVRVCGRKVPGSYRTRAGDLVELRLPATSALRDELGSRRNPDEGGPEAERFRRMLLVETPDLAVVNKPRGTLTHGDGGVDEAAKAYFADRMARSLAFVPAPLHRLDRNTSGALAVSASLAGAVAFSAALREGRVEKTYIALLCGDLREEETWSDALARDGGSGTSFVEPDGKRAEARATPLLGNGAYTLVSIRLGTGRTHQIRVQAASRGRALAGDAKYGGSPLRGGYILHCASLATPPGVGLPSGLSVTAPPPPEALEALRRLFGSAVEGVLS